MKNSMNFFANRKKAGAAPRIAPLLGGLLLLTLLGGCTVPSASSAVSSAAPSSTAQSEAAKPAPKQTDGTASATTGAPDGNASATMGGESDTQGKKPPRPQKSVDGNASATTDGTASATEGEEKQSFAGAAVSMEQAQSIALKHAGVAAADATSLFAKQDDEDGVAVYEVDFSAGKTKYEYKISAQDGSIVKVEKE